MTETTITLQDVKQHCRLDESFTQDDTLLTAYLNAALEVCQKRIGRRLGEDLTLNPAIKVGCLLYVGLLYENREMVSELTMKEVPFTISALWDSYRDVGIY